ncbi:Gfo/Idh/MocA family protein [Pseudolysinimonas yzui]|uniref:Oxidoreductase n=1 Tax=Pseudolysinimonas yzui TaxID=2708254 RepID=A0A8J3GMP3_9MICO|nr:Gfo/Idh/MocA family oxidoreductase [Pseudolysinimonas yzui]GHF05241.1 oxidoreductase [Pseudolysinimonas yzui]
MGEPHRIGVIGLGVISGAYLETIADHPRIRISRVADLDATRAENLAGRLDGSRAVSVPELLADPEVDTVLNLTIPAAHAEIALACIENGKDVFGEKPLAPTTEEGRAILAAASAAGVAVGSAPDTVLGTGIQTARHAVEAGRIGRPVSAFATWLSSGHEAWHPNPDFYYLPGGGPVLDMGPYYVTSLVHLLGPVVAVSGVATRTRNTRTIGSGPRAGEVIPVEVATHVSGLLEHANGAVSTVAFGFDTIRSSAHPIEVHGEEGSLLVPDPNRFDGDVRLAVRGGDDWQTCTPSAGYVDGARGVGLLDFIAGHRRASGAMALHVLEVLNGILEAAELGRRVDVSSAVDIPTLVPLTPAEAWQR